MRHIAQNVLAPQANVHNLDDRMAAAEYVAALSADLAAIARQHGLDTLGYVLDMARLEAENVTRAGPRPNGPA